jgi:hypothetical protein
MAANPPLFLALANLKQAADIPGLPGFPALAVYQVPRKFISSPILKNIKENLKRNLSKIKAAISSSCCS